MQKRGTGKKKVERQDGGDERIERAVTATLGPRLKERKNTNNTHPETINPSQLILPTTYSTAT
jgi:hypothetical protein